MRAFPATVVRPASIEDDSKGEASDDNDALSETRSASHQHDHVAALLAFCGDGLGLTSFLPTIFYRPVGHSEPPPPIVYVNNVVSLSRCATSTLSGTCGRTPLPQAITIEVCIDSVESAIACAAFVAIPLPLYSRFF